MPSPDHLLRRLARASEELLAQQISVVEFSVCWSWCRHDLEGAGVAEELRQRTLACLDRLQDFAGSASLTQLDLALAELQLLLPEWDHWWWVALRSGQPWPPPAERTSPFQVVRQAQRSRISWTCPDCGWCCSWDVQTAAWETVEWPGVMECPLGCSTTSSGDRLAAESPANGSAS